MMGILHMHSRPQRSSLQAMQVPCLALLHPVQVNILPAEPEAFDGYRATMCSARLTAALAKAGLQPTLLHSTVNLL